MGGEQIEKYLNKEYKDIGESRGYDRVKYLKKKVNIRDELYKGWKDGLIGGEEIQYVGIIKGNGQLERVNGLQFSYDESGDLEFIEE